MAERFSLLGRFVRGLPTNFNNSLKPLNLPPLPSTILFSWHRSFSSLPLHHSIGFCEFRTDCAWCRCTLDGAQAHLRHKLIFKTTQAQFEKDIGSSSTLHRLNINTPSTMRHRLNFRTRPASLLYKTPDSNCIEAELEYALAQYHHTAKCKSSVEPILAAGNVPCLAAPAQQCIHLTRSLYSSHLSIQYLTEPDCQIIQACYT